MAAEPERQAEALIARLAASRSAVGHDLAVLRHRLDVPARVKESVMAKPLAWFGGSLGAGLIASFLLKGRKSRPKPEKVVRRSLWSLALGGAFTLARPALQTWAMSELRKRFVIPGNDNVRSR
jgi:alpha-beta hydrolase superfamily lysophospholipase